MKIKYSLIIIGVSFITLLFFVFVFGDLKLTGKTIQTEEMINETKDENKIINLNDTIGIITINNTNNNTNQPTYSSGGGSSSSGGGSSSSSSSSSPPEQQEETLRCVLLNDGRKACLLTRNASIRAGAIQNIS